MTLRERIKEMCKEKGISLNKLETELEFAKGYISKLDKSTPNVSKLQKIADYFEVTLDYLMTGEDNEITPLNDLMEEIHLMKEILEISEKLLDISNKEIQHQKQELKELLRKLNTDIPLEDADDMIEEGLINNSFTEQERIYVGVYYFLLKAERKKYSKDRMKLEEQYSNLVQVYKNKYPNGKMNFENIDDSLKLHTEKPKMDSPNPQQSSTNNEK